MTTGGEGGMVTTNDPDLWSRMWSFKDHGKRWEAVYERSHPPGFRWVHESFGTNWRMMEVQAAIGRIQLRRMAEWTRSRTRNAEVIRNALKPFADGDGVIRLPDQCVGEDGSTHAYYKYYSYVRPEHLAPGWSRDRIIDELVQRGVPCYQGSCSEVYRETAFDSTSWRPSVALPVAHELGETSLMFLVHPTLTERDLKHMAEALAQVFEEVARA